MIRLTPRQRAVLTFLVAYERTHGRAPTLEEIAAHLGVSRQYAQQMRVRVLLRLGVPVVRYAQRPPVPDAP